MACVSVRVLTRKRRHRRPRRAPASASSSEPSADPAISGMPSRTTRFSPTEKFAVEAELPGRRDVGACGARPPPPLCAVDADRAGAALEPGEGAQQFARARSLRPPSARRSRRGRAVEVDGIELASPCDQFETRKISRSARRRQPSAAFPACSAAGADDELLGDRLLGQLAPSMIVRTRPSRMTATRAACATRSPSRWVTRSTIRPFAGELVHLAEELVRLLVGQRRVGLVEEEDAGVAGDRAGDLGALLGGERAVAEEPVARDGAMPSASITPASASAEPRPPGARPLAPDQHVLGDGEVREELRLLVDDRDRVPVDGRATTAGRRG